MGVTLVSNVPLPATPTDTQECARERFQGNHAIAAQAGAGTGKLPDAIPIPDKIAKTKPMPKTSHHAEKAKPATGATEADNVVPFGEGGPVSGPYGTFNADGAKGGFGFTGGGGDFGIAFRLVRAGGAAESFGKLAEI